MGTKEKILGIYKETTFHYIHNENERFMINATDIAKHFNINLSEFLKEEETVLWIKTLLEKDYSPIKYKVNNEQFETTGRSYTFEDIVLIDNGIYYFSKLLIYQLCKPLGMFYWWMDGLFFELMKKDTTGKMYY